MSALLQWAGAKAREQRWPLSAAGADAAQALRASLAGAHPRPAPARPRPPPAAAARDAPAAKETDPHRIAQRQKQIDMGKNTLGYQRYRQQVPR